MRGTGSGALRARGIVPVGGTGVVGGGLVIGIRSASRSPWAYKGGKEKELKYPTGSCKALRRKRE